MSNNPQQLKELQSSLKSVRQLGGSAFVSILLMVMGIAVVAGSFIYSITQLRPLEQQITEKRRALDAVEDQFNALSDKNDELRRESENAQAQLEITKKEISDAQGKLEEIANLPLPASARRVLADAILKIRAAGKIVTKVETDLETAKQTASPDSPDSGINRGQAISNLFSNEPAVRLRAYNVIIGKYRTDPELIPELLSYARAHKNNENGIYNTLVVLSHLNKTQLRPHVAQIQAFASEVEPMGPRIKERVDKLLTRLPDRA